MRYRTCPAIFYHIHLVRRAYSSSNPNVHSRANFLGKLQIFGVNPVVCLLTHSRPALKHLPLANKPTIYHFEKIGDIPTTSFYEAISMPYFIINLNAGYSKG